MFTGSSAINFESQKQLVTPSIKIISRNNYIGQGVSFSFSANVGYNSGIFWKGYYYTLAQIHLSGDAYRNAIEIHQRLNTGYTRIGREYVGATAASPAPGLEGKFLNIGETLIFYESTTAIKKMWTSNGLSWTGQTTIYTGISAIHDIAPISDTRVYYVQEVSSGFGNLTEVVVGVVNSSGGGAVWGGTRIDTKKRYIGANFNQIINGCSTNRADILLINYSGVSISSNIVYTQTAGIDILESDGINVLGIKEFYQAKTVETFKLNMNSFAVGSSYYYLNALVSYFDYRQWGGVSTLTTTDINKYVRELIFKSSNMIDWSSPIYHGTSASVIVWGGDTIFEYVLIGYKSAYEVLGRGISNLDLSNNIINYSNQNNERITLNLGNYK